MPHITSGISGQGSSGSGLDLRAIVKQLVDVEKRPIEEAQLKQIKITEKLAVFSALRVNLASLKAAIIPLSTLGDLQAKSAGTSDSNIVTVSADSSAILGTSTINQVVQLAKAHKLQSGRFDAATTVIGPGTLNISIGGKSTRVTLDAQHKSLTDIRDKINAADAGVTASVLKLDENDYRLMVQAKNSGVENTIEIDVTDDDGENQDETGLSQLRQGDGLTTIQEAQNAVFKIDEVTFTRPINTVTDAISGVTLTLKKETGENADIAVNVSSSSVSTNLKEKIESFVTAYNGLIQALNTAQAFDKKTGRKGPLLGDAIARALTNKFHTLVQGRVLGVKGAYTSIAQIGITSEKDGTMKIDSVKLSATLLSDSASVGRLFAGDSDTASTSSGVADLTLKYVSDLQSVSTGEITLKEKGFKGSIATIDVEVIKLTKQVESFEFKTRQRFSKLEGVLERLEGTRSGLGGQLTQVNNLLGSLRSSSNSSRRSRTS